MQSMSSGVAGAFTRNLKLFKTRSTVDGIQSATVVSGLKRSVTNTSPRGRRGSGASTNSVEGMKKLGFARKQTVLIKEGSI